MKYTNFIARRYLFERKRVSLINTLTGISITGVTLGTALLIVVLSVFNGFFDVVKELLLSYDPDIRVEATTGRTMNMTPADVERLRNLPDIATVAPYTSGRVMLTQRGKNDQVVQVKGVERGTFLELSELGASISRGTLDFSVQNRKPGLIMSEQLAARLGISVDDEVTLVSAKGMEKALTQFTAPSIYRFEVRGVYSVKKAFEEPVVFTDIVAAQRILGHRSEFTGLDLKLKDHDEAAAVKEKLQAMLGDEFKISTWYDLQKPLYDVMYIEKWGAFVILMIIILVAILNIVGSLTMIVIQKNRDIGILRTLGCSSANIKSIFLKQGYYIGLIGCVIGGSVGLLLCWLQDKFGLVGLSESFIISAYPVSVRILDVVLVLSGALLLCIAASWYPSFRASGIEPAQAVRYE